MGRLVPVLLRHRRAVLVVWSILCLVGAVLAAGLPGRIVPAGEAPASSQSEVVARALADSALPSLFVSVRVPEGTTPDEQNQVTTTVADAVTGVDGVTHVQPLPAAPPVDAEGAQVTVLAVSTSGGTDGATGTAKALEARLAEVGPEGVALHVGGFGSSRSELAEQSQTDLERAERFGIPIVLIVLLITFGS